MNGKWIEIFRAGRQTDSEGNAKEWTEQDLDTIATKYNDQTAHEAPVVVGHPEHNSPAFGYVESLKRDGKTLLAKLKQVPDAFSEMVKAGTYKKRSMALYPDMTLRHLGFLGGMPPAVKGLADIAFRSGETAITYEFSDWRMTGIGRFMLRLKTLIAEKWGADAANGLVDDWEVGNLLQDPAEDTPSPMYSQHEEVDMKVEEVQALIEKTLTGVTLQFSELLKPVNETITGLRNELTAIKEGQVADRAAGQRREFAEFLATPEMLRRVPEGSREATINQMLTLASAKPLEFGEGDQKKTVSALDHYKEQLQALPPVVEFNEFATGDRAHNRQPAKGDDAVTLARKASEFQESEAKAGRTVTVTQALLHVEAEADKGGAK